MFAAPDGFRVLVFSPVLLLIVAVTVCCALCFISFSRRPVSLLFHLLVAVGISCSYFRFLFFPANNLVCWLAHI